MYINGTLYPSPNQYGPLRQTMLFSMYTYRQLSYRRSYKSDQQTRSRYVHIYSMAVLLLQYLIHSISLKIQIKAWIELFLLVCITPTQFFITVQRAHFFFFPFDTTSVTPNDQIVKNLNVTHTFHIDGCALWSKAEEYFSWELEFFCTSYNLVSFFEYLFAGLEGSRFSSCP